MLDNFSKRLALKRRLAVLRRLEPGSASKEIVAIHKKLDWLESNELLTRAHRLGIALDLRALFGKPNLSFPEYFMVTDGEIIDFLV